ncbi:MAG: immunity 53 family protein [Alphaproteobacteria bacterium]|nr:immunity 53 family protein [Alphaproteobacteria bacterium]
MKTDSALEWLMKWYQSHCNGDWEHEHSISIGTLSNPGWRVDIDLEKTCLDGVIYELSELSTSETDWFYIKIENNLFKGRADPSKLSFLLNMFKELVEKYT